MKGYMIIAQSVCDSCKVKMQTFEHRTIVHRTTYLYLFLNQSSHPIIHFTYTMRGKFKLKLAQFCNHHASFT